MTANNTHRPLREDSVTSRIAALDQGESLAIVRPLANKKETFAEWVTATRSLLGKQISPPLARVKQRFPERDFETETGTTITSGNRLYVTLIVTRLADKL